MLLANAAHYQNHAENNTIGDGHQTCGDAQASGHSTKDDSQAEADAFTGAQHIQHIQGL